MTRAPTSIGYLRDPSAVRRLHIDDVVATYVVDGVVRMQASEFFPGVPGAFWTSHPELFDSSGLLPMSAGGLLIERDDATLLIDAGVGSAKIDFAAAEIDCGAMMDVLTAIGRHPQDIDVVGFTHLHFDHAGWAFAGGAQVFPNARYALAAREWAPHANGTHRGDATTAWQAIRALASDATVVELFEDGDEIVPGVRAMVTAGHSPGHSAYVISSRTGRRLVALGDAFHMPAQLAHPEWVSIADPDPAGVVAARQRLLAELAVPDTVGFGFHFGDQPFGQLIGDSDGRAAWRPVPTTALAPAPQPAR